MSPRRRPRPRKSALVLAASRLPLGTPTPGRCTSRATDRSELSSRAASDYASDSDSHSLPTSAPTAAADDAMSNHHHHPHLTTAEDKLRRQQERIQQAEEALFQPSNLDRQRPLSRGKGKTKCEQADMAWDLPESQHHVTDGSAPVSQVRVNTYGPRHVSSLSHQTAASDFDRHDALDDPRAFQTYRRRGNRPAEELNPFKDKPEVKQKTVEAAFDKRQIYAVFAKDLPGLEYINANPGFRDGMVQFIQHPNGDVSAHMWSLERYVWENIGSFSNIRKRIEGQLAGDRLKGETGWQTLQRKTLAYFRTIARQREHTAMGIPFEQANIQELLPQPPEAVTATAQKTDGFTASSVSSESRVGSTHGVLLDPNASRESSNQNLAPRIPQGPRQAAAGCSSMLPEQKSSAKNEDPFMAAGPSANRPASVSPSKHAVAVPHILPKTVASRGDSVSSAYAAGFAAASSSKSRSPSDLLKKDAPSHTDSITTSSARPSVSLESMSGLAPILLSTRDQAEHRQATDGNPGTPYRTKISTSSTREAMRDHLLRIGATAKERNFGQASTRTVMYDPFRNQQLDQKSDQEESKNSLAAKENLPGLGSLPAESKFLPKQRILPSNSSRLQGYWKTIQPASAPPIVQREHSLGESVPDTDYPTSGGFRDPVRSSAAEAHDMPAQSSSTSQKTVDEELHDWYTNGNKFARQEEMFQSIMAATKPRPAKTPSRSTRPAPSVTGTPSTSRRRARIGLPATPSAKPSPSKSSTAAAAPIAPPINAAMTRVLIPVYENLASYIQGPADRRRDYWSNWSAPPDWAIDHTPDGNHSFFDGGWGQPPARVGRDPRFRPLPAEYSNLRFGGFSPGAQGAGTAGASPGAVGAGAGAGGVPIGSSPGRLSGGVPGQSGRFAFGGGEQMGARY